MKTHVLRYAVAAIAMLLMQGAVQAQTYGFCFALESSRLFIPDVVQTVDNSGAIGLTTGFLSLVSNTGYKDVSTIQCSFGADRDSLERARYALVSAYARELYAIEYVPARANREEFWGF